MDCDLQDPPELIREFLVKWEAGYQVVYGVWRSRREPRWFHLLRRSFYRLIDYLAVGSCVIGPKPRTSLHYSLLDGKHIIYTKGDLSGIVDLCAFYLENDAAREEICRASRNFFDTYLHKDQLAAYYLDACLNRLA